jgi:hypothetical protein
MMSPVCVKKPESYIVCKDSLAATTIQAAVRVFLAKKEWENLYIRHIQMEVLRLRKETKSKAKRAKKLTFLDKNATILEALARGYIVRNGYCLKSDRTMQHEGGVGSTLMESVRLRMSIQQRIETLKQQLSKVRSAKSSSNTESDSESNNDDGEEVSIRTVERLKTSQQKLQSKARTLEAVTKPLQDKFDVLRTEHERLKKKSRKLETKNASRKYANEAASELLEKKLQTIRDITKSDLQTVTDRLSIEGMKAATQDRTKAEKRLDVLVETSSTYANLSGMNAQDASAFTDEVTRIGKEAHRKAKLLRDSVRSHISDEDEDGSATEATTTDHGRDLRNMLRDHNRIGRDQERILQRKASIHINRNISPTQPIEGGSYNNTPVISNTRRRKLSINTKRESLFEPERNRSTSPKLKRLDGKFKTSKISNKQTAKISNISTTTSTIKPMRRTYSEVFTPVSQLLVQLETTKGMRRVLSEHKIPAKPSSPSSRRRLKTLQEELRDECLNTNTNKKNLVQKDEPKDESRQPRRKSRDRSGKPCEKNSPKKSPRGKKKDIAATKKSKKANRLWWDEPRSPDSKTSSEDINAPNNQPRRHKSLNARPTIGIRTNKRTYLRKTTSLSESSKGRRRFVDQAIGARGVLPDLI